MRVFKPSLLITLVTLLILGCNGDNTIVGYVKDGTVHVTGTAYGWRCNIRDLFNNPYDEHLARFSVNTGESAKVTFVNEDGERFVRRTDDSSCVDTWLMEGLYTAVVTKGYSFPADTFYNLALHSGDTSLPFDIRYDALDPTYMTFGFRYYHAGDTLTLAEEWNMIEAMNDLAHPLDKLLPPFALRTVFPSDARETHVNDFTRFVYDEFSLPINRSQYNIYETYLTMSELLYHNSKYEFAPGIWIVPNGNYICLD